MIYKLDSCEVASASSSQVDTDPLDPKDALAGQQKILNGLYITGIPTDKLKNEQFRYGIIQKLCEKANVSYKEFDKTYIKNEALIVKFRQIEDKEKMLCYTEERNIWTNDLYDMEKMEIPGLVTINHYMTKYYSEMWYKALEYKNQQRIQTFKLTKNGLYVKHKRNKIDKICMSKQELIDYVKRLEKI